MTPERWQKVRDVLEQALSLAPEQRPALFDHVCASDSELREEVETLLASDNDVRSSFLQSPPLPVTLSPGTKLGEYEIVVLVGSGGMGEVYRARDARLGRDVAIKVLPTSFTADEGRLRRFEQEARAAAALNHPNILVVFQMGTHQGSPYLVSELLEGETLRGRLKRERLTVSKTIDYGLQVVHGLAAAHEKGIVHRDLKPENLFITKDGRVKILDFGLAKLTQRQPSSGLGAPTLALETEQGVVMGTVGYMSPEQVRGQATDHRADIFAFGAILYEMLAGRRAFQKPTSAETMTAILNEEPPAIAQTSADIPVALQRVAHRCLEKSPEQRFQSASDLAFALDALSASSTGFLPARKVSISGRQRWAIAFSIIVVLSALAWRFGTWRSKQKIDLVERQLTANPPDSTISAAAISRDGKYLAYTGYGEFAKKLNLLAIDSGEVRSLPLPQRSLVWAWFPDGDHVLLSDGSSQDLWKMSTWDLSRRKVFTGHSWGQAISPDGSHIAVLKMPDELWIIGGEGEDPRRLLALGNGELMLNVAWSPSGRRLAFMHNGGSFDNQHVVLETCDLEGKDRALVVSDPHMRSRDNNESAIAWLANGRILYSTYTEGTENIDGGVFGIDVDPDTGRANGTATRVTGWRNIRAADLKASADGKRLAVLKMHPEASIYIADLSTGRTFAPRRFTLDNWQDVVTGWTPDSKSVVFHSKRNGRWAIYKQELATNSIETLVTGPESYVKPVLSAGESLLYTAHASTDQFGLNDSTVRLMGMPANAAARSTLMMGKYVYACGTVAGSSCIVSELKDNKLTFWHIDAEKGREEEVASVDKYNSHQPLWALSPNASAIAVTDPLQPNNEIRILNLADHTTRVLKVNNWQWEYLLMLAWAADGKNLFAEVQSSSSVALLTIDANGSPRVLQQSPAGEWFIATIVPSPDGRFLAFTRRMGSCDVALLENF